MLGLGKAAILQDSQHGLSRTESWAGGLQTLTPLRGRSSRNCNSAGQLWASPGKTRGLVTMVALTHPHHLIDRRTVRGRMPRRGRSRHARKRRWNLCADSFLLPNRGLDARCSVGGYEWGPPPGPCRNQSIERFLQRVVECRLWKVRNGCELSKPRIAGRRFCCRRSEWRWTT